MECVWVRDGGTGVGFDTTGCRGGEGSVRRVGLEEWVWGRGEGDIGEQGGGVCMRAFAFEVTQFGISKGCSCCCW